MTEETMQAEGAFAACQATRLGWVPGENDPGPVAWMAAKIGRLQAETDRLQSEIDRLRAIVGRLPKTADGVPIAPGTTLWERHGFPPVTVTGFDTRNGELSCLMFGKGLDAICSGYYSTREAAEKARET